jgi:cytochrome c5
MGGYQRFLAVIGVLTLVVAAWPAAGTSTALTPGQEVPAVPAPPSPAGAPPAAGDARSVLDGVFTASQASDGEREFSLTCTNCHAPDEHTGPEFGVRWEGSSVGDLFDLIINTMPEDDPGRLSAKDCANLLAFFLRDSGYPAGEKDLPSDREELLQIRIVPLPH